MTEIQKLRHSTAHVMAAAICRIYPNVKLDIGLSLTMDWINQNLKIFENISWNYSHKS